MKLTTFSANGTMSYGLVSDHRITDLGAVMGESHPDLKSWLASGLLGATIDPADLSSAPSYAISQVTLKPVIPNPEKIICVGQNYDLHRQEMGRKKSEFPILFLRLANTQIGHGEPIWLPALSTKLDFEGELAVVIGKGGRYISEDAALDHVGGYACYNDASVRDFQFHTHQFTPGKNFPHTGAFGPWLVTPDEIPDLSQLELTTTLNGELMQQAGVDSMIFSVPDLIRYCSQFTELVPGDVLVTGTPGGIGAKRVPQVFMKRGDRVEVSISGIGVLANPIEGEPAQPRSVV